MHNVLTITLNPTVDKSSSVANIKPEKKLRCEKPKYEPGGGGINVSRGLVRLEVPTTALYTSGGRTGELLTGLLQEEKVVTMPVPVSGDTRENFIVVDTANNEQYRFGMPGATINDSDTETIYNAIQQITPFPNILVISGSLPPGISPDFVVKVIQLAKRNNCKVVIDTSGEALDKALNEGVYLIKPNIGELSRLEKSDYLDNANAVKTAKNIISQGGAELIVISMGAQGAYLITKDNKLHIAAPSVKKLSTVGAGDSMVAGMVAMLAKNESLKNIISMGVACGSAATMNPGTGLFKPDDAKRLYQLIVKNSVY